MKLHCQEVSWIFPGNVKVHPKLALTTKCTMNKFIKNKKENVLCFFFVVFVVFVVENNLVYDVTIHFDMVVQKISDNE